MLPINSVVCGDNLTVMKTFEDNSIDAIVTDPPYALTTTARWKDTSKFAENQSDVGKRFSKGFMGKEWDGELPRVETWEECLRVAKPGAHLAAFGGTRTFHRLAVAIEDAGWEIRDCINYMHDGNEQKLAFIESLTEDQYQAYMDIYHPNNTLSWTYGTGFPKSTDISKALDRKMNIEREDKFEGLGRNIGPSGNKKCEVCGKWLVSGTPCQCPRPQDEPQSDIAKLFKGYGSSLKPAWEPIILCRKPLDGTIANNVIKWGCGSLNIDACRVPTTAEEHQKLNDGRQSNRTIRAGEVAKGYGMKPEGLKATTQSVLGRFPANLILENSAEVIEMFPNTKSGFMAKGTRRMNSESPNVNCYGKYKPDLVENSTYGDSGSAARFFYSAKVSRFERNAGLEDLPHKTAGEVTGGRKEGSAGLDSPRAGAGRTCGSKNTHPCLKPLSLMGYLTKLLCPPSGIVLDPFVGSGSTCIAAMQEGFRYIGIEKETEYVEIAEKRIAYWAKECGK